MYRPIIFIPRNSLFPLGKIVFTRGGIEAFQQKGVPPVGNIIARHATGDWGDMDEQDKALNDAAVKDGGRIFSAYQLTDDLRVWVITEWDRSATTVLLPSEY
jgi:hypothetical protein